jgi:hypothetical protein
VTATGSGRSPGNKGVRAWVVRWEWAGPHAAVDQPVAAVLPPQIGGANLLRLVETLYAAREYAPDEMLNATRKNGRNPYPAKWGTIGVVPGHGSEPRQVPWRGEVICGHNPFLVARLARAWPALDGSGGIEWEDDPRPDLPQRISDRASRGPSADPRGS